MTGHLEAEFEKRFSEENVIRAKLSAPVDQPSVQVLFGPSGSGKSTILRCLAGLVTPDQGAVRFGEEIWFDARSGVNLSPSSRRVGMLFQQHALFPHLTVAQNVGYGLRSFSKRAMATLLDEYLSRFRLTECARRYPHQISGGQQQRTALARTLIIQPQVLLLDEPLSSLDALLREELWQELRDIFTQLSRPVYLVTHDRREAIALGTHLVVLQQGAILQHGEMSEVFTSPNQFNVARIVGIESILKGQVIKVEDRLAIVRVGEQELMAVCDPGVVREVHVCIRGEDVSLRQTREAGEVVSVRNQLAGKVLRVEPAGALVRVHLDVGFSLTALVTRHAAEELKLSTGVPVIAQIKATAIHLMPMPLNEIEHRGDAAETGAT